MACRVVTCVGLTCSDRDIHTHAHLRYMENRRREQQERMRKRKRRDATSSEENDQSATADAEEGTGDHARLDWTNESFTGGIQIAPGHVIETDLDRLEEKIKRRAVMQRMVGTYSYLTSVLTITSHLSTEQ